VEEVLDDESSCDQTTEICTAVLFFKRWKMKVKNVGGTDSGSANGKRKTQQMSGPAPT